MHVVFVWRQFPNIDMYRKIERKVEKIFFIVSEFSVVLLIMPIFQLIAIFPSCIVIGIGYRSMKCHAGSVYADEQLIT